MYMTMSYTIFAAWSNWGIGVNTDDSMVVWDCPLSSAWSSLGNLYAILCRFAIFLIIVFHCYSNDTRIMCTFGRLVLRKIFSSPSFPVTSLYLSIYLCDLKLCFISSNNRILKKSTVAVPRHHQKCWWLDGCVDYCPNMRAVAYARKTRVRI